MRPPYIALFQGATEPEPRAILPKALLPSTTARNILTTAPARSSAHTRVVPMSMVTVGAIGGTGTSWSTLRLMKRMYDTPSAIRASLIAGHHELGNRAEGDLHHDDRTTSLLSVATGFISVWIFSTPMASLLLLHGFFQGILFHCFLSSGLRTLLSFSVASPTTRKKERVFPRRVMLGISLSPEHEFRRRRNGQNWGWDLIYNCSRSWHAVPTCIHVLGHTCLLCVQEKRS